VSVSVDVLETSLSVLARNVQWGSVVLAGFVE